MVCTPRLRSESEFLGAERVAPGRGHAVLASVLLSHHAAGVLIRAHGDVLGMAQFVGAGPFSKIDTDYHFGLEPHAARHLLVRQALSPAARAFFGQIDERAL